MNNAKKNNELSNANYGFMYELWWQLDSRCSNSNNNNNVDDERRCARVCNILFCFANQNEAHRKRIDVYIYYYILVLVWSAALTLFLHVTWTRYFVSGQRDNSTLDESVNMWPVRPPPPTSHETRHLMSSFAGSHAKCVATKNSCLIIDATRTVHWLLANVCSFEMVLHISKHWNESEKTHEKNEIC